MMINIIDQYWWYCYIIDIDHNHIESYWIGYTPADEVMMIMISIIVVMMMMMIMIMIGFITLRLFCFSPGLCEVWPSYFCRFAEPSRILWEQWRSRLQQQGMGGARPHCHVIMDSHMMEMEMMTWMRVMACQVPCLDSAAISALVTAQRPGPGPPGHGLKYTVPFFRNFFKAFWFFSVKCIRHVTGSLIVNGL